MMSRRRSAVLAATLAALVLVQVYGLDRQPETREEEKYRNIADIPASDMVPVYIASLFFGAFRAVVVDALWIQLKKVEDERRWYEAKEVLKLISYFQPRNSEVWAHLGWQCAFNVANGFTHPDRSWEWVKFGLEWLREGNRRLPDSSYLKFELGRTLYYKPSWRDGALDRDLLARIEADQDLQKSLRLEPGPTHPMTAFELAIPWLEAGRDELFRLPNKYVVSQAGLYIRPLSMDGMVRESLFFQGVYLWHQRRWEEAQETFRRLAEHTQKMVKTDYGEFKSSLFEDMAKFYARLPEIVELDRRAAAGGPAEERMLLEKAQAATLEFGPLDHEFLVGHRSKTGRLDLLKQKAAGGRDRNEFNDSFESATPGLEPGALLLANLDPQGLDVDYYRIELLNPVREAPPDAKAPRPIPLSIRLRWLEGASLPLKATLYDPAHRALKTAEGSGDLRLEQPVGAFGVYFLKVEPASIPNPWPSNTGYSLRYDVGP